MISDEWVARASERVKDFRDWIQHCIPNATLTNAKSQFDALLKLAIPIKFWYENKQSKSDNTTYRLDTNCLLNFLQLNGFYTLKDEHSKDTRFIRIVGNVVKDIKVTDITNFIKTWAERERLPREVRNLIIDTSKISARSLAYLSERELDIASYTPNSQLFFFGKGNKNEATNETIRVDSTGIHEGVEVNNYVWEQNVIPHKFSKLADMFNITQLGNGKFDIDINSTISHVFGYLINSSRIYWQKEPTEKLEKFVIDSPMLSDEEIMEQKQCQLKISVTNLENFCNRMADL